ncbi:MAG TPA: GxxExxY protein [bacterium]
MERAPIPLETERVVTAILDGAFKVHRTLGPGLLESAYEACLAHELTKAGVPFRSQVVVPIEYDGEQIEAGFRLDLWVAERVIVELKAVEDINKVHEAQLHTYLKLTGMRLGLLINFNVKLLRDGLMRVVY